MSNPHRICGREEILGCLRELTREVVQCNFDTAQF